MYYSSSTSNLALVPVRVSIIPDNTCTLTLLRTGVKKRVILDRFITFLVVYLTLGLPENEQIYHIFTRPTNILFHFWFDVFMIFDFFQNPNWVPRETCGGKPLPVFHSRQIPEKFSRFFAPTFVQIGKREGFFRRMFRRGDPCVAKNHFSAPSKFNSAPSCTCVHVHTYSCNTIDYM